MKFIKYNNKIFNLTELKCVYFFGRRLFFDLKSSYIGENHSFYLGFSHLTEEASLEILNTIFNSFLAFLKNDEPFFDVNEERDCVEYRIAY